MAKQTMKTQAQDWIRYNDLRRAMSTLIKQGRHEWQQFSDAFEELTELKRRHGGMPPVPTDIDAADQELAEMGVEKGTR